MLDKFGIPPEALHYLDSFEDHYILIDRRPVRARCLDSLAQRCFRASNPDVDLYAVAKTHLKGREVSTVFIPRDLEPMEGAPPTCFETMIFPDSGEGADVVARYETWEAALAGHHATVRRVSRDRGRA